MIKKSHIAGIILLMICIYFINQIAFFHDREFERAVRETLNSSRVAMSYKRDKILTGILWKEDLRKIEYVSINFREYNVKSIKDIKHFRNVRTVWFSYASAYRGDTSIYKEEHVLDDLYLIKKFKYVDELHLYHLKINEDVKEMFLDIKVFID